MILSHWKICAGSCLFTFAFVIFSAFYASYVNTKRTPDDPKKRDFSPNAPWLTPIVLPLIVIINIPFIILYSLAFGVFLLISLFTLILFRNPFFIKWILKLAKKIGNTILRINTEFLRATGFYAPSRQY